ncbi:MAG: pseudouridine synthase [Erysipelotrichaceae bacterium]
MERLQKVMSACGVCSRRKAEELILAGKVKVNGEVVKELGTKVSKKDDIMVNGKLIQKENKVYYVINKPKKYVCSLNDEHKRATVTDLIPCEERIYTVGRLDYDTTGVLILTNDGEFANELMHPAYHLPKVYELIVSGILTTENIKKLERGIELDDGIVTLPSKVWVTNKDFDKNQTSLDLTIYEGRYHQVKRMMEAAGHTVRHLHRKKIGFLECKDLQFGQYRLLKPFEVKQLRLLAKEGKLK